MTSVLNEDLFYEIFAACSVSTLVNICLVSTRFYMAAMPYLLRDVTFDRSPELLSRFLHFIIDNSAATSLRTDRHPAQPHIAAQRLRIADPGKYVSTFELYERGGRTTKEGPNARSGLIHVRPEPYPCKLWAPLLTQAISLMPNLRSVAIHSRFDKICRCSPQFAEVLLTRPRLTSFTVPDFNCASSWAVGEVVRERKADMSKLRKIAFDDADAGDWDDMELLREGGFGSLIFACREHLEELVIGRCCMDDLPFDHEYEVLRDGSRSAIKRRVIYPSVGTIHFNQGPYVDMANIASSFPSLHTLKFPSFDRREGQQVSFPHLVSLYFDTLQDACDFFQYVGPPPNLRRLVLARHGGWGLISDRDGSSLAGALRGLRSLHVCLRGDELRTWKWVVQPLSLSALRYLSLSVRMSAEEGRRQQIMSILDPRPLELESIPLEYLSLTLVLPLQENEMPVPVYSVALPYARSIKSLKFISLGVEYHTSISYYPGNSTSREIYWWKVLRTASTADLDTGSGMDDVQLEILEESLGMGLRDKYDQSAVVV